MKHFVLEFVFDNQVISSCYSGRDSEIDSVLDSNFPNSVFEYDELGNRITYKIDDNIEYYKFNGLEFDPSAIRKYPIDINHMDGYYFLTNMRNYLPELADTILPLVAAGKSRNEIVKLLMNKIETI